MIYKIAWLAVAGAAGTVARYVLAGLVQNVTGAMFPWGTAVVNIVGCFAAGLLWALFEHRVTVTPETRIIILIGFMGAFTTFSAFILETGELVRASEWLYAAANVGLQNGLGFVALFVGIAVGRMA
jgi:CrcB protein